MKAPNLHLFQRLGFTHRILFAFAAALAVLAGATFLISAALGSLKSELAEQERMAKAAVSAQRLEGKVIGAIPRLRQNVDDREKLEKLNRDETEFERARLRELTREPEVLAALDAYEETLRAIQSGAPDSDVASHEELENLSRTYLRSAVESQAAALGRALARNPISDARWAITANLVLSMALIAGIALLLARDVSRRIAPLVRVANQAARGETSETLTISGSNEFAQIGSAFNKLTGELRERDRIVVEFLELAARHLHRPATAIKAGLVTLLEGESLSEGQKKILSETLYRSRRQLSFLENLATAIENDAGNFTLSKSETDLYALVDSVVTELQPMIDSRNQRIAIKDPGHSILLMLDAAQMGGVLKNLVTNASQNTQDGGRIDVSLNDYGNRATVSVRDTGSGISPENLEKLFRKFVRFSPDTDGCGLGLYLAKQIVTLHGGEISVESEVGKGSRFTIQLPDATE